MKNNYGWTPIHRAAREGHTDAVKLLMDHGANNDVKDNDGETPIYWAAVKGHTGTVKLLLSAGADPQIADDKGKTARERDITG